MIHPAPPGWRLQVHDTIGSTQDAAIGAAREGDPGHLAILAGLQTSGRGSRGRSWTSTSGNLHLSAFLRLPHQRREPGTWALMAGLVLHEAAARCLPHGQDLQLKWPNDLLLSGAKLGGVLIDSTLTGEGTAEWLVVGFGLNLLTAPQVEGRRTACLAGLCPLRSAPAWACDILAGLDHWAGAPSAAIRDAWLDRAHPIGTWLTITTASQQRSGAFDGLAPDGSLRLAAQPSPVSAGEVFIGHEAG